MYVVDVEDYRRPNVDMLETNLEDLTSDGFLNRSKFVLERYQEIIDKKLNQLRPLVERYDTADGTVPIVIGMRSVTDPSQEALEQGEDEASIISSAFGGGVRSGERGLNTIITELLGKKLMARRKYMNTLSNGLIFYNLYLTPGTTRK